MGGYANGRSLNKLKKSINASGGRIQFATPSPRRDILALGV
jgi:hypothetical protein